MLIFNFSIYLFQIYNLTNEFMIVSIIWATSWFGLWTAKFIKKKFPNTDVIVTWRNEEKWKKVANENNLKFTTNNIEAVKQADIIIFSVPISNMEQTIKELAPYAKKWAILSDVCSIKWFPSKAMKQYAPKWCLIIPTHPMFGPYVEDIAWQIFVLTVEENERNDKSYIFLKNFLQKEWAKVIETTAENHDKMMAVVQGLTHINMFTVWETIKRLSIPVEETLNFVSPIYKLMISSVARYVWHDAGLYADIQMYNPKVLEVHNKFMEVIQDFNKTVQNKDKEWFSKIIYGTKEFFWPNMTSFWQKYTDKLVYFVTHQIKTINESIWKNLTFKNIYSWEKVSWKVKKLNNNILEFEDGNKIDINEYVIE